MGTIYLKADLTNITIDNINQFNIDQLDSYEVNELIKAGHRNLLFQLPLSASTQYYIHRNGRLTHEECELIIDNSTEIWDELATMHEYSSELLLKNGDKLARLQIEGQRNITPEFVVRYGDMLSMGSLFSSRERYGDLITFLVTPELSRRYILNYLSWRSTKETVLLSINQCNFDEQKLKKATAFIDQWFDTPVDINRLINDYQDQDRASYSISVVENYWNEYSLKTEYKNWEEYVNECKETGDDGLANTWFKSFFCSPFLEILG